MKHQYSDADKQSILKSLTVLCDSREQVNHHVTEALAALKCPTQIGKLEQGDYTGLIPTGRLADGFRTSTDTAALPMKSLLSARLILMKSQKILQWTGGGLRANSYERRLMGSRCFW